MFTALFGVTVENLDPWMPMNEVSFIERVRFVEEMLGFFTCHHAGILLRKDIVAKALEYDKVTKTC